MTDNGLDTVEEKVSNSKTQQSKLSKLSHRGKEDEDDERRRVGFCRPTVRVTVAPKEEEGGGRRKSV